MLDAYIYNGLRTSFGRNAGVLAKVRPDDMLGGIIAVAHAISVCGSIVPDPL